MKMRKLIAFVSFIACALAGDIELPPGMQVCHRDSPTRNDCLKESIQSFLHAYPSGIEALGIPAIDPYLVKVEHFEYNQSAITGYLNIKQAKSYGISESRVIEVRSRFADEKMNLELELMLPNLLIEGQYRGEGRVNSMQMSGKGFFNITFANVKATWKLTGEVETIDGEEYMKIKKFNIMPEGGKMKLYASGIFPDPQINAMANDLINQNWEAMYRTILPQTRQYWEPILVEGANKVFLRIPFKLLFPKPSDT